MVVLKQKQRIILSHINGKSNRSIAAELHMSKDTVNKYVNEYEQQKSQLLIMNPEIAKSFYFSICPLDQLLFAQLYELFS